MPVASGLTARAGFQREALELVPTWPAATPALVTQLLPLLRATVHPGFAYAPAVGAAVATGPTHAPQTAALPSVALTLRQRYGGLETLVACGLGMMAPGLPNTIEPGAYEHLYTVDALLSTMALWSSGPRVGSPKIRRGTLAIERGVSVWEFLSCMVQALSWHGTATEVTCEATLVAYGLTRVPSVNAATMLDSIGPDIAPNVLFPDLVCTVNGVEYGVTEWAVALQNHLKAPMGPLTGLAPDEYEREKAPEVTGTLTLPRYDSDILMDLASVGDPVAISLSHVGPVIPTTTTQYEFDLSIPYAILETVEPSGPEQGLSHLPVTWRALASLTESPLTVRIVSDAPSHPLL